MSMVQYSLNEENLIFLKLFRGILVAYKVTNILDERDIH